jgi:hypothetical protein
VSATLDGCASFYFANGGARNRRIRENGREAADTLSNIAPAIVIALISLAYLEEDGLLLCFGLLAAVVLISVASAAVWGAIVGAAFISHIW